jgi:hypothetical protein
MRLKRTPEYIEWYESQRPKDKAQISKRLSNIEENDHFGVFKNLGNFWPSLNGVMGGGFIIQSWKMILVS